MDSVILSRIAMVGWLFLVVFIGSLWSTDSPAWQRLVGFLHEKDSSVIAIGVVGALAGVATPPALGFLMERVVTLILIATNRSVTVYPQVKNFKESLASEPKPNLQKLTGEGVFHVYFYTYAHANLLNWSRRRVAQVYASATGVLAVLGGLICGLIAARSFNLAFVSLCLAFAAVLFNDARIQSNAHRRAILAWIQTAGQMTALSKDG